MKIWKEVQGWGLSIIIGFIISMFIGIFVIQPYKVNGHSMEPTLDDKQRIYAWKIAHALEKLPKYEDIVIIDSRIDRDRTFWDSVNEHPLIRILSGNKKEDFFYVKRVIGLPGDVIEIKDGQVFRNGIQLEEPYIKEQMYAEQSQVWEVPEDHIFVMGDNRNNSKDSRMIGPVPLDHIMGIEGFNK
ncbi:signal peptidase I [Paenibacillus woosongensis]|uniref:Signal peptidase I n=1 Tax=Paenibacillus woosongensis TaxID=307580 RepID=A0A7X2Z0J5_9BACL|nr:signal peptidase I [Paenibacillus woosongensis]MUG44621.1 signal peptidase I [Paenibacillus woosongensis]